ncbi:hypothetical protein MHYP_G00168170 [Metynnis hypsauchen]
MLTMRPLRNGTWAAFLVLKGLQVNKNLKQHKGQKKQSAYVSTQNILYPPLSHLGTLLESRGKRTEQIGSYFTPHVFSAEATFKSLERVIEELGRFEVFAVCLVFLCCFLSESERQRQKEKPTFPPPVVFYQRAALHRPLELRRLSSQAQTAGVMRASRRGKEFQQRCQSAVL